METCYPSHLKYVLQVNMVGGVMALEDIEGSKVDQYGWDGVCGDHVKH